MTKVELTLPDALAAEAQQAGLLTQERLEQWIRQQISKQKLDQIFAAVDQAFDEDGEYVTPEEVSVELHAMRAAKRNR